MIERSIVLRTIEGPPVPIVPSMKRLCRFHSFLLILTVFVFRVTLKSMVTNPLEDCASIFALVRSGRLRDMPLPASKKRLAWGRSLATSREMLPLGALAATDSWAFSMLMEPLSV